MWSPLVECCEQALNANDCFLTVSSRTTPSETSSTRSRKKKKIEGGEDEGKALVQSCDAKFWFEDGTLLVIAGDGVAFKVYSGILAYHSETLKEMISQGPWQATSSTHEQYGCELVLHLSECGEDIALLFDIFLGKRYDEHFILSSKSAHATQYLPGP